MTASLPFRALLFLALTLSLSSLNAEITIANGNDSGPGSLRQAIADAAPNETIRTQGRSIKLTSGPITITQPLHLVGGFSSETGGVESSGHRGIIIDLAETPTRRIAFVSLHETDAPSAEAAAEGLTEAPDKPYTDLLRAAGFEVERWLSRNDPDSADATYLNGFDLIIISRSINSAHFNEEASFWNTDITAPIINMAGYTLRSNRLAWTDGTAMGDETQAVWQMTPTGTDHPIMESRSYLYANPVPGQRGVSISLDDPVGGVVLSHISPSDLETSTGSPTNGILEYPQGATVHNGDTLAGKRLFFPSGSREADGVHLSTSGFYDLTPDGAELFLRAVAYFAPHPRVRIRSLRMNGGGIENENAILLLDTITGDACVGTEGGYLLNRGQARVRKGRITGCMATTGGGISNHGTLEIDRITFDQCQATQGAAIRNTGELTVLNSTFTKNSADTGAIYTTGSVFAHHATIADNAATSSGGGIVFAGGGSAVVTLRNTIVAGNTAPTGPDIYVTSSNLGLLQTEGVNLISNLADSGLAAGSSMIVGDAHLAPLTFSGGYFRHTAYTLFPLASSPAIDAGGSTDLTVDQHGRLRAVGSAPDIGAYESGTRGVVTNTDDSGPGSLRGVLDSFASGDPDSAVVTFASNLAGQTITINSQIDMDDIDDLVIDGSSLSSKVTVEANANNWTGNDLFEFSEELTVYSMDLSGKNTAGVGFHGQGTDLILRDVTVSDFTQAGVHNEYTDAILEDVVLARNGVGLEVQGEGGGLAQLTDVKILDSLAGGITDTATSSFHLDRVVIANSGARAISGYGMELRLTDCTITGNQGGIESLNAGEESYHRITMNRVTFDHNVTTSDGGALFVEGTTAPSGVLLNNVTMAHNEGSRGGAIFYEGDQALALNHVTITENSAGSQGGGIANMTPIILTNTLIAANAAPEGADIYQAASDVTLAGVNLMTDLSGSQLTAGPSLLVSNSPGLAPLGDFGGLTQTVALLPGSPAVNEAGPSTLDTDQRGLARTVGAAPDIGAYESGNGGWSDWITAALPSGMDYSFDGDPDNDAISSGVEYALGMSPLVSDNGSSQLPSGALTSGGATRTITFGFHSEAAVDTTWVLLRSTNLQGYDEIYRFHGPSGMETMAAGITAERTGAQFAVRDSTAFDARVFYQFRALRP